MYLENTGGNAKSIEVRYTHSHNEKVDEKTLPTIPFLAQDNVTWLHSFKREGTVRFKIKFRDMYNQECDEEDLTVDLDNIRSEELPSSIHLNEIVEALKEIGVNVKGKGGSDKK